MLQPFEHATPVPRIRRRTETLVAAVRSYLVTQLRDQMIQPGTRIDDPEVVAEKLSVPGKEARMAYSQLAKDGVIKHMRGFGYVARDPWVHDDKLRLPDIADSVWRAGCEFSADIISKTAQGWRCPPPPVRDLTCATFYSAVLFHADDRPVQLSRWWVSSRLFIGYRSVALRLTRTMTYLRRAAPHLSATHSIDAILADRELSHHLRIDVGAPCLMVQTRVEVRGELAAVGEEVSPSSRLRLPDEIVTDEPARS